MFQFSLRSVVRIMLLLVSLVSLCAVCDAGKIVMNDTRYDSNSTTQWRLAIWTAEDGMTPIIHEDAGTYKVYTSQGVYQESYLYWWTCSQAIVIPNKTVMNVVVEGHVPGNTDENERDIVTYGSPTYTIEN